MKDIKYIIGVDLGKTIDTTGLTIVKVEEDIKTVFLSLTGEPAQMMYECLKELISYKGTVKMAIEEDDLCEK